MHTAKEQHKQKLVSRARMAQTRQQLAFDRAVDSDFMGRWFWAFYRVRTAQVLAYVVGRGGSGTRTPSVCWVLGAGYWVLSGWGHLTQIDDRHGIEAAPHRVSGCKDAALGLTVSNQPIATRHPAYSHLELPCECVFSFVRSSADSQ